MIAALGKVDHFRHLRRFAHSHSRTPGFLLLSPAGQSCVRKMTVRKENLATCTRNNYSLRSCSNFGQIGTIDRVHSGVSA